MDLSPGYCFLWRAMCRGAFLASRAQPEKGQLAQADVVPLRPAPASARNLHKNPQILGIAGIRIADGPRMVGPWGKSSAFKFADRGCHGGY